MFRTLPTLLFTLLSLSAFAQMTAPDGSVRYGNEWIDYEKTYLRVQVAEDGMYRISAADISAAGLSGDLVLFHDGEQVPLATEADGSLLFFGEKNRGKMDRHLWPDPDANQLNDRYSMHSDTTAYYLTTGPGATYAAINATNGADLGFILRRSERIFSDQMVKNYFRSGGVSIYYSHYDRAEGFGQRSSGDLLSSNGQTESTVELELPAANGEQATLDVRFGTAFGNHEVNISADGNLLAAPTQSGWGVLQERATFSPNGQNTTISLRGTRGDQDKPNLAWVAVTYPAATTYDENLTSFTIPASGAASRVTFTGLGAAAGAGGMVRAYAPEAAVLVSAEVQTDGSATMVFPAAGSATTYQLVTGEADLNTPVIRSLSFTPTLPAANGNYLLLTSRRLHGPAVDGLADYRRSVAGGSYRVTVVDVEDLYDEYGYGIPNHPMAVRNYLAAAKNAAPGLQYLFLVGKGREYFSVRTAENLADNLSTYFIPSFGFPASDNLLAAKLGEVVPQYSIGRLAAINDGEVSIYLDKLREVEAQINQGGQTIADRDWLKQIMHLGGGGSASEQSSIKSRLAVMKNVSEGSQMAANVTSFFKTSSEPIEDSRQEAIFNRINDGTALLTFMGHSSSQTFDFSIDDPANYNNKGRYPFMISLGCYSGDAFTRERSISERFIFLRDKGAVAFAASKGLGYISALGTWGRELFDNMGNENYGEGIGDAVRGAIQEFSGTSNFTMGILLEQFSLSGDPAYRLHPRPGPDFVIDPASVSFEPDVVPAQNETYTMNLRLLNLGSKTDADSMNLRFRQELPSGEVIELKTERVAAPVYDALLAVELPNQGISAVGQNRVFVSVDVNNEIDELPAPAAELNNELETAGRPGIPLTIIANTAKVAFPPPYAVIGGELELIASTTNALAPARDYVIQVSSDRKFNNLLSNETVNSPGGVIRYTPPISPTDSTTYYWRISPDSVATEGAGFIWSESSFSWVAGQPEDEVAWALQDPGQTIEGEFINIKADTSTFGWNFAKDVADIKNFNAVYKNSTMPRFEYNGQRFAATHQWRVRAGLQVIVIDSLKTTTSSWLRNPGNREYNSAAGRSLVWAFDTRTQPGRDGLIRFMDEAVEDGKYVFVYSVQRGNSIEYYNDGWLDDSLTLGKTIFDVMEEEGALQMRSMTQLGSVPYLFAFQKGMGALSEAIAQNQSDTIFMQTDLFSNWGQGNWASEKAGPALKWNSVSATVSERHLTELDSIQFRLIGSSDSSEDVVLREGIFRATNNRTLSLDISDIDASAYPFLWIEFDFYDDITRDVPTISSLYFNFDSPGDVAISPLVAYGITDSIQQGQDIELLVGYENISRIGMDSLLVELNFINDRNELLTLTQRRPPLPAQAQDRFSFIIPTDQTTTDLRYNIIMNPRQDQPENVLVNNVLNDRIKVGTDLIDPVVQVLFDGVRINDGDLVSSTPEIHIQIKDENPYLRLNDTSAYFLELTYPDGRREQFRFDQDIVEFVPANGSSNSADIFIKPELTQDGTYTLEILGQDRSSNLSGRLSLRKDFEVITQQMVSNVLAYPNPFTTQTRFVYTLTGNEPPVMFRIQIMTVSGRMIRDIDLTQTEELKIGTHQTDFAWDGTDEYGDMLANGVYLYRVITSDGEGQSLDKFDTNTDQFFNGGIGKVVLIR